MLGDFGGKSNELHIFILLDNGNVSFKYMTFYKTGCFKDIYGYFE